MQLTKTTIDISPFFQYEKYRKKKIIKINEDEKVDIMNRYKIIMQQDYIMFMDEIFKYYDPSADQFYEKLIEEIYFESINDSILEIQEFLLDFFFKTNFTKMFYEKFNVDNYKIKLSKIDNDRLELLIFDDNLSQDDIDEIKIKAIPQIEKITQLIEKNSFNNIKNLTCEKAIELSDDLFNKVLTQNIMKNLQKNKQKIGDYYVTKKILDLSKQSTENTLCKTLNENKYKFIETKTYKIIDENNFGFEIGEPIIKNIKNLPKSIELKLSDLANYLGGDKS